MTDAETAAQLSDLIGKLTTARDAANAEVQRLRSSHSELEALIELLKTENRDLTATLESSNAPSGEPEATVPPFTINEPASAAQPPNSQFAPKLTPEQRLEILALLKQGESQTALAHRFGVSTQTIYQIKKKAR